MAMKPEASSSPDELCVVGESRLLVRWKGLVPGAGPVNKRGKEKIRHGGTPVGQLKTASVRSS